MARRLFDIDRDGVRQVLEDLAEALDVVGFPKPLENWENEDSKLRAFAAGLDNVEADDALDAVEQQLRALEGDLPKWNSNTQALAAGRAIIGTARKELRECCTWEEPD